MTDHRGATDICRAAVAILQTERPLSRNFREQMVKVVEALDECLSELSMMEQAHMNASQPFYSLGLEMGRATFKPTKDTDHD